MHPEYFAVRFRTEAEVGDWPDEFAVITAYATTGQTWTDEENEEADRELRHRLGSLSSFVRRVTGYSATTGHAEPGWAVGISFEGACDLALEFKQDAIYFVRHDELCVSLCDARRALHSVGRFSDRLDPS